MKVDDKIKNYCALCYKTTNHTVLYSAALEGHDYNETTFYGLVKCAGCDNISYRTENIDYEQLSYGEDGEWEPTVTIKSFPKVLLKHRQTIYKHSLPDKIGTVYIEAIKAFSCDCFLLAGVAFRAIIEAICIDKNISGRDLNTKITNLAKSKLITEKEAERLQPIRFMGNDSVHDMTVPTTTALYIVLNVIEHLLNNLYIIDEEIRYNLETVINNFSDFRRLLREEIGKRAVGDRISLSSLLGKSYRRLHNRVLEFETELQSQIKSGEYKKLSLGDVTPNSDPKKIIQNYVVTDVVDNDNDFEF